MILKEFYRKEEYIALHAQSRRFRIVKYCVLLAVAVGVYAWKGLAATGLLLLVLFLAGICLHFFFRWKTEAWTKSWGFTSAFLSKGNNPVPLPPPFQRSGLHVLNVPGKNTDKGNSR